MKLRGQESGISDDVSSSMYGGSPGKRTTRERLPIPRRAVVASAWSFGPPPITQHDDPFGLHLEDPSVSEPPTARRPMGSSMTSRRAASVRR